jgi:NAD(P)H-flavin reductase
MRPTPYRLVRRRRETRDTATFEYVPAGPEQLPALAPGQFNMLSVFGVGEAAFSSCGESPRPGAFVHTIRAVGALTQAIHRLKRGAIVGLRGPFGNPWPLARTAGKDVLLIAGGLGIAPLRGALRSLLKAADPPRRVTLLYGARSPIDLVYRHELRQLRRRGQPPVLLTVDRPDRLWRGHVGVVPRLLTLAAVAPGQTIALVCGPEVMMRFTARALGVLGIEDSQIYVSLERNMSCALGFCGHCQFGPVFICRDGPVFRYDRVRPWLDIPEL